MGEMSSQNFELRDAENFAHLFNETHLYIFRYIYGLHGGSKHEIEDLTAETYTRAWKARHSFVGNEDSALRWLFQIARNLVIDTGRRNRLRGTQHSFDEIAEHVYFKSGGPSPEDQAVVRDDIQILGQLLNHIPYHQREMIVLRYIMGWQVKSIASYLNMPENTVSVNIRRILERLRNEWPRD